VGGDGRDNWSLRTEYVFLLCLMYVCVRVCWQDHPLSRLTSGMAASWESLSRLGHGGYSVTPSSDCAGEAVKYIPPRSLRRLCGSSGRGWVGTLPSGVASVRDCLAPGRLARPGLNLEKASEQARERERETWIVNINSGRHI
jgi:hypothetical protein